MYGCETWPLTLRAECKLRVFENSVLRKIFGLQTEEVTWEWRRLYNEEINKRYSTPNIVRVIKSRIMVWAGHVALMGERRGAYRILVGKSERKPCWWVPVTTAWRVLRLRIEERPPIWRVAANKLNKQ